MHKPNWRAIVFIDGNNLYHTLKRTDVPPKSINLAKLSSLVCRHFNAAYVKTLYYNSVPDIRDGQEKYYKAIQYLDSVRRLPHFAVKTRKLQKNSTAEVLAERSARLSSIQLCEDCKPVAESNCNECVGDFELKEKGVDVIIAVDMIDLSVIKNECDYCILISGDADFIPAMDAIASAGKTPVSASPRYGYNYNLRQKHGWFILDRKLLLDTCRDTSAI